jgi:glutamine synthetase
MSSTLQDQQRAAPKEPEFAVPPGFKQDPQAVAAVRAELEEAGVEHCYAAYVDVHGIPKAKTTPMAAFEKMCNGKELYTVGAVEGLGLVGPHEDECATVPDLDSRVILPWNRKYAWFASDLYYHGQPYANDPRGILRAVMAKAKRMGFTFNLGIEPEFYVFKLDPDTGEPKPITTSDFKGGNACYDLNLTSESTEFLEPMVRYINELGWKLYSYDQECGKGQHEFDFGYADALTMSDRFIFLRLMARKVAQSIGAVASFMPKPFSDDFRSGAHFNMSLADASSGENLFAPEAGEPNELAERYGMPVSKLCYHFTAGLLRHAKAITAVTCSTYNSYQGLIAQGDLSEFSWAPVLITYGRNNRSSMLRLPANRYCVENRAVDMSVNPYLAAAISLAAGLEGIERALDPGEPFNGDLYQLDRASLKAQGIETLPPTLLHAVEAFEEDPIAAEAFGEEYPGIYAQQKRRDWQRSFFRVGDEERRARLTFI